MAAHVRVVEVPDADRRELERRVRDKGALAREVERAANQRRTPPGDGCPIVDRVAHLSSPIRGDDDAVSVEEPLADVVKSLGHGQRRS